MPEAGCITPVPSVPAAKATLPAVGMRGILVVIATLAAAGIVQSVVIRFDLLSPLAVPLDAGATVGGRPVFGANKTWRGVLVMTAATTVAAWLIFTADPPVARAPAIGWPGLGVLMGLAYVAAELPNSFVKRRLGIGAGKPSSRFPALHYVVDQADSAIGVAVVVFLVLGPTVRVLAELVILGALAHAAFDLLRRALSPKQTLTGAHGPPRTR